MVWLVAAVEAEFPVSDFHTHSLLWAYQARCQWASSLGAANLFSYSSLVALVVP